MIPFPLVIRATAFFIAGCALYFSVRGIALPFVAVSTFTIPIMLALSLEIGKSKSLEYLKTWHQGRGVDFKGGRKSNRRKTFSGSITVDPAKREVEQSFSKGA